MVDAHLDALRSSVARLRDLTSPMTEGDLTKSAYPSEWTIADVLSHLGSGAVISGRRLEDGLAGSDTPEDFAPGVWAAWNDKSPTAKRDDALAADADLLARLKAVTAEDRRAFAFDMGPLSMGFIDYVAMRLNEHAVHTWDIEVTVEPGAAVPGPAAALVVDNLELIARYTAKPTGDTAVITVATTEPARGFTVELAPDRVTFAPTEPTGTPELELPAETLVRLVYGRAEAERASGIENRAALDLLRRVFPGP